MKSVLSGKVPQNSEENCHSITSKVDTKINTGKITNEINKSSEESPKPVATKAKENEFQCVNPKNVKWPANNCNNVLKKRPGRPPKAGTSKKIKKASVTALYLGKLSNVVPFKYRRSFRSRFQSSESDESLVIFY
jgi:hypothetical protein